MKLKLKKSTVAFLYFSGYGMIIFLFLFPLIKLKVLEIEIIEG